MRLIVFVALMFVAVVTAVKKKPCCGPRQYMAGYGATVGQVDPAAGPEGYYVYQNGAFDYTNQQFGYDITITYPNGTHNTIRLIQKYKLGAQWIILKDLMYCLKQPTTLPEPSACIPANASFVATAILGGPDGLMTDAWTLNYTHPKDPMDGVITVNVVSKNCYPALSNLIATRYDSGSTPLPIVASGGILNMTLGIPEPDKWFELPSFCNQAENEVASSSLFKDFLPALRIF